MARIFVVGRLPLRPSSASGAKGHGANAPLIGSFSADPLDMRLRRGAAEEAALRSQPTQHGLSWDRESSARSVTTLMTLIVAADRPAAQAGQGARPALRRGACPSVSASCCLRWCQDLELSRCCAGPGRAGDRSVGGEAGAAHLEGAGPVTPEGGGHGH